MTTQFNDLPALSTTLWYAGCRLRCGGCQNTELEHFRTGLSFEVIEKLLEERRKMTDWLVHLGGNPVDSVDSLIRIVKIGKRLGFRQFLYTGYELDEMLGLLDASQRTALLEDVEYIKTGRYDACMKRQESSSFFFETVNQKVYRNSENGWVRFYEYDASLNKEIGKFNYEEVTA